MGPDLARRRGRRRRADEGLPGGGERARRAGPARAASSSSAAWVRRWAAVADQDRQDREAFPGAGVHAGLAAPLVLAAADLLAADRAGRDPRPPAGRVVDRPVRQVEVEGADRGQALPVVDPRDAGLGRLAAGSPDGLGDGAQPLLPGGGDVGGQAQAVDARVVVLQVGPEQLAEHGGQRLQAGVVQRGLAFLQVVHQQVADRAAGQPVAVDQLGGRPLPAGAQLPQRRRGPRPEDAHRVQHPVEQVRRPDRGAVRLGLGVQQLQDVAGGDVAERAALGGHDERGAVDGPPGGGRGHGRVGGAAARSRRNPSGSRDCASALTSVPLRKLASASQLSEGLMMSALMAATTARVSTSWRCWLWWPCPCSQAVVTCRQEPPATSAPLASQRSCQVSPGWSASQSSSSRSPSLFPRPALRRGWRERRTRQLPAGRVPVL